MEKSDKRKKCTDLWSGLSSRGVIGKIFHVNMSLDLMSEWQWAHKQFCRGPDMLWTFKAYNQNYGQQGKISDCTVVNTSNFHIDIQKFGIDVTDIIHRWQFSTLVTNNDRPTIFKWSNPEVLWSSSCLLNNGYWASLISDILENTDIQTLHWCGSNWFCRIHVEKLHQRCLPSSE